MLNHYFFSCVKQRCKLAREVLNVFAEVETMICPNCRSENEMAYSVLSRGMVCLDSDCSFELEMEPHDAEEILESAQELVCC
jgi:hypothetical protein